MTCPRCDGLLVREYLLNPREGSLSGFHGSRCVNCGAIHDDLIRTNQRVSPSLKRVRSPVAGCGPCVSMKIIRGALAPCERSERKLSCQEHAFWSSMTILISEASTRRSKLSRVAESHEEPVDKRLGSSVLKDLVREGGIGR